MAVVQEVIIVVKGDDKQIDSTLTKLEKMGAIDKKNAEQFQKTQKEFQDALKKRNERIDQLQQRLGKLAIAQAKAFDAKKIERINKIIKQTQKEVETLGGKFEKQAKKTNKSLSQTDDLLNKITKRIVAAFAIDKLVSFTKEAFNMAAELEGVKIAFDRLNKPGLLDEMRKATLGTVNDLELMKQAVRAQNFQVPLEKLGTFFEFARRRAKETGESVDFLVNSIILGIGRKSPLILDNLGISAVALREEFKRTGDTVEAMSNIVEQELAKMGQDVLTTSEKVEQFSATWDNLKIEVGTKLIPVFDELAISMEFLTDLLTGNTTAIKLVNEEIERFENQGKAAVEEFRTFRDRLGELRGEVVSLDEALQIQVKTLKESALAAKERGDDRLALSIGLEIIAIKSFVKAQQDGNKTSKELTATLTILNKDLTAHKTILKDAEIGSKKFREAQAKIKEIEEEIAAALGKQTDAQKEAEQVRKKAGDAFLKQLEEESKALDDRIKKEDEFFDKELKANIELQKLAAQTQAEKIAAIDAGVREETRKFVAADEQFKLIVAKGEKDKQDIRDKFRDERLKKEDEVNKELEKQEEESTRRRTETANMSIDFISNLNAISTNKELQRILTEEEAIKTALDNELKNEKLTKEQKEDLRETADEELRKLRLERAEADKKQAKFNIRLNTAQAIVAALASVPPNIPLSIAVAAIGLTELAVVNSEPIPEFAKGTKKVKGGKRGKDSVLAWLMPGEGVIPETENTQYSGPVSDIIDGTFHKNYMHKDEVTEIENSFAQNVANSLHFNDENMLFAMQQGRRQEKKLMNGMVNAIVNAVNKSNQRRFRY